MAKYLVVLVVVLFAAHVLLSRKSAARDRTATGKSLRSALESTVTKLAVAAGVLVAALVVILLVKHVTA